MRLFVLVLLAFFASFLAFRRERFAISEFLFLLTGIIVGMYVKGLETETYKFFEVFLIGFFGIIYGMSLDISAVIRSSKRSLQLAFLEFVAGLFYMLVISIIFHPHNITLNDKIAILAFIMISASSYFIESLDRERIVASFLLPAIVSLVIGFFTFNYKGFLVLLGTLIISGLVLKISEDRAEDTTMALSIILGAAILIPYIALRYGQSPFLFSFLLGLFLTNLLKSKRLLDLIIKLKEEERMFFLAFLFMIGLFTNLSLEAIKIGIVIFLLRLFYKITVSRIVYSTRDVRHFVSQGALSLVIAMDLFGHGAILKGWGASIVMAYLFNIGVTLSLSVLKSK